MDFARVDVLIAYVWGEWLLDGKHIFMSIYYGGNSYHIILILCVLMYRKMGLDYTWNNFSWCSLILNVNVGNNLGKYDVWSTVESDLSCLTNFKKKLQEFFDEIPFTSKVSNNLHRSKPHFASFDLWTNPNPSLCHNKKTS